jgi:hypothetical protein
MKSRAAMAIGALNKQGTLFTSKLLLYLRKKPVHLVYIRMAVNLEHFIQ